MSFLNSEVAYTRKYGNLNVWNILEKEPYFSEKIYRRSSFIRSYKPGTFITTSSKSVYYKVCGTEDRRRGREFGSHSKTIYCCDLCDSIFVTGGLDSKIKVWDLEEFEKLCEFRDFLEVYGVSILGSKKMILSVCYRHTNSSDGIRLRDLSTQTLINKWSGDSTSSNCCDVTLDENGCLTASSEGVVKFWDLRTFEEIEEVKSGRFIDLISVLSENVFAFYDFEPSLRIYDLRKLTFPLIVRKDSGTFNRMSKIYRFSDNVIMSVNSGRSQSSVRVERISGSRLEKISEVICDDDPANKIYDVCKIESNFGRFLLMNVKDRKERLNYLLEVFSDFFVVNYGGKNFKTLRFLLSQK